jgi:predicted O-methyltransferase YrrM
MIDARVMQTIEQMERFQQDRNDSWNIPREQGLLLHQVALAAGCRRLVEVGTSYGYSGLFLAAAARDTGGVLDTFDRDPDKHAAAREFFTAAGLEGVVRLRAGDALEKLAELDDGIDFAFLDATKVETDEYWRVVEPKLAARWVLAVDNTTSHAAQLGPFVEMLRGRPDLSSCDVPVGHGFELAVRPG